VTVGLAIDVRELLGQPGSSRWVRVEEGVPDLGTELARVPAEEPVRADLVLENVVDGVLASGRLSSVMRATCARCLGTFERTFDVRVQELFAPGATPEDDEYPLAEERVDLEPMIRDAIVLAMPFSPLCRPDCLGLCERCGGDRNQGECRCPPEELDLRWAALSGLDLPDVPAEP
jgi:uncharacterized protein